MRAIFSQCFNTSQLASVPGRSPPPPSPPRQRAARPAPPARPMLLPPLHHCLSHCLSTAPPNTPKTAILSEGSRQIRAQSKVRELTLEHPDIGNTAAPSNTHTVPQAYDWLGQCCRGGDETHGQADFPAALADPESSLHCQAWETKLKTAPLAHFLYPFQSRDLENESESGTKDSGQELFCSRRRIIGRALKSQTEEQAGKQSSQPPCPAAF